MGVPEEEAAFLAPAYSPYGWRRVIGGPIMLTCVDCQELGKLVVASGAPVRINEGACLKVVPGEFGWPHRLLVTYEQSDSVSVYPLVQEEENAR